MNDALKQMSALELELRSERIEILRYLRDEKERQLLITMLESNICSSRRIRHLKELAVGRMLQSETDDEVIKGSVDHLQQEREHLEKTAVNCLWPDGSPVEIKGEPPYFGDGEVEGRQPLYDEMDVM